MNEKNSFLTNDSLIFVFQGNQFKQIKKIFAFFNISIESDKESGVEAFQVRLKGQKTIERSMREYSTHWI